MKREKYINETHDEERAFYNYHSFDLDFCSFRGVKDGESALKECSDFSVFNTSFELRYPLWHCMNFSLNQINMSSTCRAPLWYSHYFSVDKSILNGVKALRECSNIDIKYTNINSVEFGWKCNDISISNSFLTGEYAFFYSKNIKINDLTFKGKYSFQYVEDMEIDNASLDTKDAFWHSKNVTVRNSIIQGEYLAWYSENLTLINCTIIGTQPLCYCKNLKLIDCKMIKCDLAFEYSDVNANVKGFIDSIKNPISGSITSDSCGELLLTKDSKYPCNCLINIKDRN